MVVEFENLVYSDKGVMKVVQVDVPDAWLMQLEEVRQSARNSAERLKEMFK